MKIFGYELCAPAYVYFVVALISVFVMFFLSADFKKIPELLSQILSIILCALILTFICNSGTTISWIITGMFVCLTILGYIGMASGRIPVNM